jgi:phenylalanyl-tRNA synthetase beta chain
MLRYGINDLRLFFEGDLRFLSQFPECEPDPMQFSESWLRSLCNPALSKRGAVPPADHGRPRSRGERARRAASFRRRRGPGAERREAPRRRQAQAVLGRCRRGGAFADRLRRAQRCRRHEGALCAGRREAARHRDQKAKVRGIEASACSARRASSALSEDHGGLLPWPADAPVGRGHPPHLDLDDRLITLKLTPNRADCLSLLGIARELSALTGCRPESAEIVSGAAVT